MEFSTDEGLFWVDSWQRRSDKEKPFDDIRSATPSFSTASEANFIIILRSIKIKHK